MAWQRITFHVKLLPTENFLSGRDWKSESRRQCEGRVAEPGVAPSLREALTERLADANLGASVHRNAKAIVGLGSLLPAAHSILDEHTSHPPLSPPVVLRA